MCRSYWENATKKRILPQKNQGAVPITGPAAREKRTARTARTPKNANDFGIIQALLHPAPSATEDALSCARFPD